MPGRTLGTLIVQFWAEPKRADGTTEVLLDACTIVEGTGPAKGCVGFRTSGGVTFRLSTRTLQAAECCSSETR